MKYLYSKYFLKVLMFLTLISSAIYPQWDIQYSQSNDLLHSIYFSDYDNGWAVGGRIFVGALILKSTDGGINWNDNHTISNTANLFESVYFIDENTGWVVGGGGVMMRTTNAGSSWDTVTIPTSGFLKQIQFIDENYGWAVGVEEVGVSFRGIIIRTTDSGLNWERIDMGVGNFLNSFYFINQSLGWGVGTGLQKTTDGGFNWQTKKDTTGLSIYFSDELNGWSVGVSDLGPYGFIHKTTDGGDTWSSISNVNIPGLQSVNFFDKNIGWAVGSGTSGTIIKTTDGGNSWFHQESGTVNSLRSVYIIDSVTGWTVGGDFIGYILKTTNGGVTFINEDGTEGIPTYFSLLQNYPNPFNPSTTIKFTLPFSGYATLKIYNALGKEVTVLLDKELTTGTYKVEWNASNVQSGVYFYQLQADSFIETKKMILMK